VTEPNDIPLEDELPVCDPFKSTLGLRGERVIAADADTLIDLLARDMAQFAHMRVRECGAFHLALSGGSTPQALYQHLMIDPRYRLFPWPQTHLWLVDDRCVAFDDERSNWRMIRELIVDHVDMPAEQVHPMPVLEDDGDAAYEAALRAALRAEGVGGRLDFVLLGMGGDGHTASLFPHTAALDEAKRWVVFNDGETVAEPRPRMTMTYPLINSARRIAALITGDSKHAMVQAISLALDRDDADVARLPITGVQPIYDDATLVWYLDRAAACGAGG